MARALLDPTNAPPPNTHTHRRHIATTGGKREHTPMAAPALAPADMPPELGLWVGFTPAVKMMGCADTHWPYTVAGLQPSSWRRQTREHARGKGW